MLSISHHTTVAVRTSFSLWKGDSSGSPSRKFPRIPPAKHSIMLPNQHASGCWREKDCTPPVATFIKSHNHKCCNRCHFRICGQFGNKKCGLHSIFMVPDVKSCAQHTPRIREPTIIGSVLYGNRYWYIISNRLRLYWGKPDIMCITAGLSAVNGSHYTGRSKGVHISALYGPKIASPARPGKFRPGPARPIRVH